MSEQIQGQPLIPGTHVRVTTTYYGFDVYDRRGIILAVTSHAYPYTVLLPDPLPGYASGIVRQFDWYELEMLVHVPAFTPPAQGVSVYA